jgi:hypothetical protein
MTKYSKIALCALVFGAATFTSCSKSDSPAATASIYARLGGTTMVADPENAGQMIEQGRLSYRKVIKSTIGLIVADIGSNASGNLGAHFAPLVAEVQANNTTGLAELTKNLTDFFSFNTGGTNAVNTYTGDSMAAAHNPATNPRMGVKANAANYTKFEGYVGAAAVSNGVAANTQLYTDIVAVLESLRPTIVQQ